MNECLSGVKKNIFSRAISKWRQKLSLIIDKSKSQSFATLGFYCEPTYFNDEF